MTAFIDEHNAELARSIVNGILTALLSENAIVLVVDGQNNIVDYRVEPIGQIAAQLSLHGFGQPVSDQEIQSVTVMEAHP